jgi:hypothetical protein
MKFKIKAGLLGDIRRKMDEKANEQRELPSVITMERKLSPDQTMVINCKIKTNSFDENPKTRTTLVEPCKVSVVSTKDASTTPVDDKELGAIFFKQPDDKDSDNE